MEFHRGEALKSEFNTFWTSIIGESDDYFSRMTNNDFDMLKTALSNVNNIITYNSTIELATFLAKIFDLSAHDENDLLEQVRNTKPNANGFDIQYSKKVKIVAEVKCNRPVKGGNRFGAEQKNGIAKDLRTLFNGKRGLNHESLQDYYKILGVYRFDSKTEEAIRHYLKHLPEDLIGYAEMFNADAVMIKEKVYVVLLNTVNDKEQ